MGADDDRNWVGVVFERTKRIMEDVCECYWLNLGILCRIWDLLMSRFSLKEGGGGRGEILLPFLLKAQVHVQ